jgi:hypothetical protein
MKKHFNKFATFTALVLISSVPFSNDMFAGPEKKPKPAVIAHAGNPVGDKTTNTELQTTSNSLDS